MGHERLGRNEAMVAASQRLEPQAIKGYIKSTQGDRILRGDVQLDKNCK